MGLARLNGLFAAYKPPGLKWLHLRDTVEQQLLKGLNAAEPSVPEQRVRFLLGPMEGNEEELALTATSVPTLTKHRLVCGPAFTSLKIGVGHRLDIQSSGVLVLGVGRGRRLLTDMYDAHLTKDYTVRGLLGKATDDFHEDGRLVEKTTYALLPGDSATVEATTDNPVTALGDCFSFSGFGPPLGSPGGSVS